MYILGLLSIFQIVLLPGLIIQKIIWSPKGFLQRLIYAFGYSLIFNHLYVVLLTYLGINFPAAHYVIFLAEVILIIYLYRSDFQVSIGDRVQAWNQKIIINIKEFGRSFETEQDIISKGLTGFSTLFFLAWSIISIFWAINLLIDNLGSVFTIWDSVVSWNSWAVDWFSNRVPIQTWRYPQLIPTNFSLTYSFLGSSTLQFFAKGFMPLFAVYFLLLLFDLGLAKRSVAYFSGIVASQYILKRFYLPYISSGYVDVALVFFTFLTIHTLLKTADVDDEREKMNYVLAGFIFAAGTALTKQNGLFVFGIYPILAYLLVIKDLKLLTNQEKIIRLVILSLVSAALLAPWYVFNEIRILQGAKTNVLLLASQDHHSGRSTVERLVRAYKDLSVYFYLYPLTLITLPFMKKDVRKIILFVQIPYSLIWVFFFSLYTRNLSIGFALLGFAAGHAVAAIIYIGTLVFKKIKISRAPTILGLIATLVLVLSSTVIFPDSKLVDLQTARQKYALNSDLNEELYEYFENLGSFEPIFTNYPLRYLPGFEDLQINIGGFEDYQFYHQKRAEYPEVEYMLISLYKDNNEVVNEINDMIDQGYYEKIFKLNQYLFVRILD